MSNLPQNIAKNSWLGIILIILFVLSAYSPILQSPFKVIYDSDHIVNNPVLQNFDNTGKILTNSLFKADMLYRPVVFLSHAAEYQAFTLTPFFYYLVNIFLHLGCALLVYALMVLLTRERSLGFLTALLFAVHPAHWEVVSLLSGRGDLFNTFFNLAALTACILYMRRLNGGWMLLSLMCFSLALLSHESRGFLVWIFFFYFLCVTTDEQSKGVRWLAFLPYAVVAFLFMGLRHGLAGLRLSAQGDHLDAGIGILAAAKSVLLEAGALIIPADVHYHRTAAFLNGPQDIAAFVALALLLTGLGALWIFRKKVDGVVIFLLVWFFVALWPVLKIAFTTGIGPSRLPLTGAVVYMPLIPLAALVVMGAQKLLVSTGSHSSLAKPLVTTAAVGFITLFFLLTFRQNVLSGDESAMLEEAQRREPTNASIEYSLGLVAMDRKITADAQDHFERASQLDPELVGARMGLGKVLYDQGKFLDAVKVYESVQKPGRYQAVLENNLRATYGILISNQEALLQKNSQDVNAYFSLGVFYAQLGEWGRSIAAYQNVIDLDPHNQTGTTRLALQFQGMIYQELGNTAKAQENFDRAR